MPMGNERSGIPVGERTIGRLAPARRRGRNGAFDSAAQDPARPSPGLSPCSMTTSKVVVLSK